MPGTVECEELSARLFDDQLQWRKIPDLDLRLEPDIHHTSGKHAGVQWAAIGSNSPRTLRKFHHARQVRTSFDKVQAIRAEYAVADRSYAGDAETLAIQIRPSVTDRPVCLIEQGKMRDTYQRLALFFERNQNAPESVPPYEVARAVNRIDDPAAPARPAR